MSHSQEFRNTIATIKSLKESLHSPQALEGKRTAEFKAQNKSCSCCSHFKQKGFLTVCSFKKKFIKSYNICHLHINKEEKKNEEA